MIRRLVKKWRAAKVDPEKGELLEREWRVRPVREGQGFYGQHWVALQVWLCPTSWGIGIAAEQMDWLPGGLDGRRDVSVHVGPVSLYLALCQPIRESVAR